MPVEKLNKEVIKSQLSWIWIVTQQNSCKIIQWLMILGYSRILERRCRQIDCLIITGVLKGVRLTALNTSNDKRTDRLLYEGIHLQSENVTRSWKAKYVAWVYSWRIPRLLRTWHKMSLQWRHNASDGASNDRRLHCLLNCWFRHRSKKTSKVRITGLCAGNSPVIDEFPAQKASNAENFSIWRYHAIMTCVAKNCGSRWHGTHWCHHHGNVRAVLQ